LAAPEGRGEPDAKTDTVTKAPEGCSTLLLGTQQMIGLSAFLGSDEGIEIFYVIWPNSTT
jgi:hypothetical protein